jgi:CheY-like chemotaxis protein
MAQVLIVDDEPETVELLARIVALLGHEPLEANGFASAASFLELAMPDLVLLDLMMPEVDGFETMRRIRAMPEGSEVPIVIVTASPELNLTQKVKQAGGNALLHKPIGVAALSDAIEAQLKKSDSAPLTA